MRCVGGQPGLEQQLGHADDAVHRRADLVAHLGQERALRVAGRLGRLARQAQRFFAALALGDVARDGDAADTLVGVVEQGRDGDLDVDGRARAGQGLGVVRELLAGHQALMRASSSSGVDSPTLSALPDRFLGGGSRTSLRRRSSSW